MKFLIATAVAAFLALPALGQCAGLTEQQSVLAGEKHLLDGYTTHNTDGTINVVVEIPAGTTAKYEVDHKTGLMVLEQKNGKPRYVQFLPYPGNYGLIPRTIMAREFGGDGDPLDAIVLGDAVARGSVIKARPLGVLLLKDHGEEDSKILMAAEGSPFDTVNSIKELDARFPGVTKILETWFTSYKGVDKNGKSPMHSDGIKDRADAVRVIGDAALAYERTKVKESDKPKLDPNGNPYPYFSPEARNIGD